MSRRSFGCAIVALVLCAGVQARAEQRVLTDGFDGAVFSETGGLYYKKNAEQAEGAVEFQTDVARTGAGALKLTIKPKCAAADEDCSERAEIWEKTDLRVPYDEGVWYGFAVRFAEPIPRFDHRYLIAQWKREIEPGAEGDFSPFLALRLRQGKLFATVETNYFAPSPEALMVASSGCEGDAAPVWYRPETNQMRALVAADASFAAADDDLFNACTDAIAVTDHGNPLPVPESGWIDFAVYVKPGADGSGHIEIFANGKPVVTVKGRIGHADKGLGENQYFKFGPYRDGHTSDWTLYYDDFRRSPRCADVLVGAPCPFP